MPDEIDAAALAKELGVEPTEPLATPPPPETPPKGEETPEPPDETKPPGEGDQPPEGEKKDGEEEPKGETPPDPLVEFTKDPEKALRGLLAHPTLGPMLNQWADTAAKHQVEAATKEAKDATATAAEQAQIEKEDKLFDGLSKEELAEGLNDPEHGAENAAAYGRYQLRKQQPKAPTSEDLDLQVKVQSTLSLVQTYRAMVDGSDLSDEVKARLQPENYTQYGAEALPRWGKDIYEALVQLKYDTEWESVKETRLAELDKERPGSGGGRPPGVMPDLMETPSDVGLETALRAEAQKKK